MNSTIIYSLLLFIIIFKDILLQSIIDFNHMNDVSKLMQNINKKIIILIFCITYSCINSNYKTKMILSIIMFITFLNYKKINNILNQILHIYNNTFLINKFMLV